MTHFVIDYYDINIAQFHVTKESLCLDRIVLLNVFVICMKMYVLWVVLDTWEILITSSCATLRDS